MISLVNISSCEEHLNETFALLNSRRFAVSRQNQTSFENHIDFVSNHPYRYWFLIEYEGKNVGTVYIHKDNSIGLNLIIDFEFLTSAVLKEVIQQFSPLPPIPSVRNENFIINVPTMDDFIANEVRKIGGLEIQRTFVIEKKRS